MNRIGSALSGGGSSSVVRVYRMFGIGLGVFWAWNHGQPAWEHALKFGILMFVVAPLGFWLYDRRSSAQDAGPRIGFVRLTTAKAALLAVSLVASWLLQRLMGDGADFLVAAWLAVVVAAGGPALHPLLLVRRPVRQKVPS